VSQPALVSNQILVDPYGAAAEDSEEEKLAFN